MKKNLFKKTIYLFLLIFILPSCQSIQDGLTGKKKSNNAQEFLIDKKNPLILPPDYAELPIPSSTEFSKEKVSEYSLKEVLSSKSNTEDPKSKKIENNPIKNKILKKIKKN